MILIGYHVNHRTFTNIGSADESKFGEVPLRCILVMLGAHVEYGCLNLHLMLSVGRFPLLIGGVSCEGSESPWSGWWSIRNAKSVGGDCQRFSIATRVISSICGPSPVKFASSSCMRISTDSAPIGAARRKVSHIRSMPNSSSCISLASFTPSV